MGNALTKQETLVNTNPMKTFIIASLIGFLLTTASSFADTEKSNKDNESLFDQVDTELGKAQKKTKSKLSDMDKEFTKESQKWNKKILGSPKKSKTEEKTETK